MLDSVSLSIRTGETYGVIGPSGAGKTSLLRLLNGLEDPDDGMILLDGRDIADIDVLELRRRVGTVFQAPALFPATVGENIEYPLTLLGFDSREREARARECLARVGLPEGFWDRPANELSQGEQQRVSIARALANEPEVLLMDEPTSALDPSSSCRTLSLVRSLNERLGVTIVFVTHLMDQAREVCDRALVLIDGRGVEEAETEALFTHPRSELTRLFINGRLGPGEDGVERASVERGGGSG